MCLALIARDAHPEAALIVAANRDEFHARASEPARFWDDPPDLLAGRDAVAGGTWFGVTRNGRFALVTNYHEPGATRDDAPSRGDLPIGYLAGDRDPAAHVASLQPTIGRYNGFNLLLGDPGQAFCLSNRDPEPVRTIAAGGVHGLGNRLLDSAEPKLDAARAGFANLLNAPLAGLDEALFVLLADRSTHGPDERSPDHPWRDALSAIFVAAPGYGTRCSTLLFVDRAGRARFIERRFDADGGITGETRETWRIEKETT
ncbi:MAG: NRDE family protein [Gammaproteobacteria bacterium]|nr:NRDE family protein [Gammaproteobacteria bacterium]